MERKMEMTMGMRIRECRIKMGMTQEELAEAIYTKKCTISAYETGKIDIKVSILKDVAKALNTTAGYLMDGNEIGFDAEIMQVAKMLQEMKKKTVRKVAIEQMKALGKLDKI
jgi:transcriptional regulator with XRE-family HTH domain